MEYFVIGEREIVLAFKLVGVDGSVSVNRTEALDAFNRITGRGGIASVPASERPKVLILTEEVSSMLEDEVLDWQKGAEYRGNSWYSWSSGRQKDFDGFDSRGYWNSSLGKAE